MDILQQANTWLQQLPPAGVLGLMFLIAYVENIFPPSPSDVLLVFAGTLIGLGTIGFPSSLFFSTLGSTLGFMTAYGLGRYFEGHIVEGRFGRYLPVSTIARAEQMFQRFGYGVIIANRFLAGTRAIVSFAAGMSRMNLPMTTAMSAVGAALWNAILLSLGMIFGKNWQRAREYLSIYSTVVTVIVIVVAGIYAWRYFRNRRQLPASTDV
ncbi:MAG: DedA family protein [Acidobacteriota bacterium]|nr:DedA family protein [Acidobacteriota bacterium]